MLSTETTPSLAIRRTPGVCGGRACIRQTRIPVWLLVEMKQLGWDETRMLADYPSLTTADLDAAWGYHREHPAEIEEAIADDERDDRDA